MPVLPAPATSGVRKVSFCHQATMQALQTPSLRQTPLLSTLETTPSHSQWKTSLPSCQGAVSPTVRFWAQAGLRGAQARLALPRHSAHGQRAPRELDPEGVEESRIVLGGLVRQPFEPLLEGLVVEVTPSSRAA